MTTASPLEERMARIEGILDEIRSHFNHVETRLASLEVRSVEMQQDTYRGLEEMRRDMDTGFTELRRDMESQFRWLVGILLGLLIPMWVSIILAIIFSK